MAMSARFIPVAFGFFVAVVLIVGYNWYPVTPVAAQKTARLPQPAVQTAFLQTRFGQ
jgi:putative copper export protein